MTKLAPPYDFAVLDNGENPRSLVYDLDTGKEVCTFGADPNGQRQAEACCKLLNLMSESVTNERPERIEQIRKQGIDARCNGTPRSDNPYSYEASQAWDAGWMQAEQAINEEEV